MATPEEIQALQLQAQWLQEVVTALLVIGFVVTGIAKVLQSAVDLKEGRKDGG